MFNYELSLETSIASLIETVATDMQNSASQYQFAPIPRRANNQNLLLLGLVNRGQGRGTSRQSYLKPWPRSSGPEITIMTLAQDRYNFSSPLCITRENRFVIYLGMSVFKKYLCTKVVTTFTAVSHHPLIHVENDRNHTCLWSKLIHLFPGDSQFGEEDNSWCESEGEPCDGTGSDGENVRTPPLAVSD